MSLSDRKEKVRLIEQDIERTRADMDHTIGALRARFSVDSVIRTGLDYLGGPNVFLRNLGETVRDNPVPFLLTSVGITWLAVSRPHDGEQHGADYYDRPHAQRSRGWASRMKEKAGALAGRARSAKQSSGERSHGVGERASELAHDIGDRASGLAHDIGDRASGLAQGIGDRASGLGYRARRAGRYMSHAHRDNPFLAPLLGIAAGAALGALFPSTRAEDELMGPTRDEFVEPLARSARETADETRHRLRGKTDEARHRMQDKGAEVRDRLKQSEENEPPRSDVLASGSFQAGQGREPLGSDRSAGSNLASDRDRMSERAAGVTSTGTGIGSSGPAAPGGTGVRGSRTEPGNSAAVPPSWTERGSVEPGSRSEQYVSPFAPVGTDAETTPRDTKTQPRTPSQAPNAPRGAVPPTAEERGESEDKR